MVAHSMELDELLFSSFFMDHGNNNELKETSSNLGKTNSLTIINNKINNVIPANKSRVVLVSFKVDTHGLYLIAPRFRINCPSGYNVILKIASTEKLEYELGAYNDSYMLTPNGYSSSCYPIAHILDANVPYFIIGQTTYTSPINIEYISIQCILLKQVTE